MNIMFPGVGHGRTVVKSPRRMNPMNGSLERSLLGRNELKSGHYLPLSLTKPRFSGRINQDYSVEMRSDQAINARTVAAVQQGMLLRHLLKGAKADPASLKLYLDGSDANEYRAIDRAALSDTVRLVNRPVDVIVKSFCGSDALSTLLSATGKRLVYSGAELMMGPVSFAAPYGRNDDQHFRRELNNEYVRDMEYLVMSRAGVSDRSKVYQDLSSAKSYNALQALAYGTKGLVDGILMGPDRVITRQNLDQYFEQKKLTPQQQADFVTKYMNIYKLPTESLAEFAPASMPSPSSDSKMPALSWYQAPQKKQDKSPKKPDDNASAAPADAKPQEPESGEAKAPKLEMYLNGAPVELDKLAINLKVKEDAIKPTWVTLDNVQGERGVLDDDVLFFNEGFSNQSAEQITEALLALDAKKSAQTDPSHIKLLVNSPGGAISAGHEIRSTIEGLNAKVDMIVTGMAASCGAFLLSSVTGNRMATPTARVMIHDAWFGIPTLPNTHANELLDMLDQVSVDFVGAIANAAQRPFEAVWKDMKADVWLNPVEAMFYGKRGLLDAILVGGNTVVTKEDVKSYLLDQFQGDEKQLQKYIDARLKSLRTGNRSWKPEQHNGADPFENALQTIERVAQRSAKWVQDVPTLAGAVSRQSGSINYYTIANPKKKP